MTVKELIDELQKMNPDDIVVLSGDSEGNDYQKLYSLSDQYNYANREIGLKTLSEDDGKHGYTEEDLMEGQPCVVLWPA
jgi:hypothetical protein